jgi:hypothetical protein
VFKTWVASEPKGVKDWTVSTKRCAYRPKSQDLDALWEELWPLCLQVSNKAVLRGSCASLLFLLWLSPNQGMGLLDCSRGT